MGTRGRIGKGPSRHKQPEKVMLPSVKASRKNHVPKMPEPPDGTEWCKEVKRWWDEVWKSPMASQWLTSDALSSMTHLCRLHQEARDTTSSNQLIKLLDQARRYEVGLGMLPLDRQRQNWEITKDDEEDAPPPPSRRAEAAAKPAQTAAGGNGGASSSPKRDPRDHLV